MTHNDAIMPQQNYAYLDMAYNNTIVTVLKLPCPGIEVPTLPSWFLRDMPTVSQRDNSMARVVITPVRHRPTYSRQTYAYTYILVTNQCSFPSRIGLDWILQFPAYLIHFLQQPICKHTINSIIDGMTIWIYIRSCFSSFRPFKGIWQINYLSMTGLWMMTRISKVNYSWSKHQQCVELISFNWKPAIVRVYTYLRIYMP